MLTNLLSNAIKFSPRGGRIEVIAEMWEDTVRVAVRDHGEGIAAQDLSKLFRKFSQIDSSATRRAGGTGLGLVICRGIVRAARRQDLGREHGRSGQHVLLHATGLGAPRARTGQPTLIGATMGPGRRRKTGPRALVPDPRVLLIESLDAAGAAPADAVLRARALEQAGGSVVAAAVGPRTRLLGTTTVPLLHDRSALRELVSRTPHDRMIVASAERGGGIVAGWLASRRGLRWWPSGVGEGWRSRFRPTRTADHLLPVESSTTEPWGFQGLDGAVIDRSGPNRRLSLWDGDYVLAPAGLAGAAGMEALKAFAAVAAERDELDLVVLAHPDPEWSARARRLGIGQRVHFAGVSPRDAERVWSAAAAAIVIATDGAISGGLMLRMLDSAGPLVVLSAGETARVARAWLAGPRRRHPRRRGALRRHGARTGARSRAEVERAIETRPARAARHGVEAFAARLAPVLHDGFEASRKAA